MSQFVVSARKYRPSRFEEVVGQSHITDTLRNAVRSDKLGQAFLFCGPRGVGKTTCARILARVINCEKPGTEIEPCGSCASCKAFADNASFNIHELDAASNNSVDDIRHLNEQVRFMPQQGKYKVYIIDEVHMLSTAAFNAFLKTLEEPPSYAVFILATTEKHKILPTILSRCQIFDFRRILVPDMVNYLKSISEKQEVASEDMALHIIGQKADGALRDALSLYDRLLSAGNGGLKYDEVIANLNMLDYEYFFRLTDALIEENGPEALVIYDEILRKGFEGDVFIGGLAGHFRDLLVCKNPKTAALLDTPETLAERYSEQATKAAPAFLLNGLNICNEFELNFRNARNKRLHIELALLKIALMSRIETPGATAVKKKSHAAVS